MWCCFELLINYLVLREQSSFISLKEESLCGDDGGKDPPVSIPNTAVKLPSAEDSEGFPLVKAGRCRAALFLFFYKYGDLAQLGEHLPYKQRVSGSSPLVPIFI